MSVKPQTEHRLEFLSFKGGYTGLSESTRAKCHNVGNHMSRLICHYVPLETQYNGMWHCLYKVIRALLV